MISNLVEKHPEQDHGLECVPGRFLSQRLGLDRRKAVLSMAAAVFAYRVASAQDPQWFPFRGDPADARVQSDDTKEPDFKRRIELPPSLLAAETKVLDSVLLKIDHAYEPQNQGERLLRMPCVVPPRGYALQSALISTLAKAVKGGRVLLPCPRDILDQLHAGCAVQVAVNNGVFDGFKTAIIEATSTGNGYKNPFLLVEFTEGGPAVEILAMNGVLIPEYPDVDEPQILASLDPARRTAVRAALKIASHLKYNAANATRDIATILRNGSGDCGSKASLACFPTRQSGQPCVEFMSGYGYGFPSPARNGGKHSINFVTGNAGAPVRAACARGRRSESTPGPVPFRHPDVSARRGSAPSIRYR